MPRKPSYWNYLPKAVCTGRNDVSAYEVLNAWGVENWGKEEPFYESEYIGWCMVHLPVGWTISLEQFDFFLLDHHGQVRGDIRDAFERRKDNVIVITDEELEEARIELGISEEELADAFPPDEERKEPEKPRMELRTAIRFQTSFSGAGAHTMWAEDPMGNRLFAIYDEPVSDEEWREKIPRLEKRVFDWLNEHYPDWRDHTAYWDSFVEMDKQWSLPHDDISSMVGKLLANKTDDDLRNLRAEMGTGEKYTDYLVALQPKLAGMFGQSDDIPPFYIASNVAWYMKLEIYKRTGLEYR